MAVVHTDCAYHVITVEIYLDLVPLHFHHDLLVTAVNIFEQMKALECERYAVSTIQRFNLENMIAYIASNENFKSTR